MVRVGRQFKNIFSKNNAIALALRGLYLLSQICLGLTQLSLPLIFNIVFLVQKDVLSFKLMANEKISVHQIAAEEFYFNHLSNRSLK